MGLNVDSEDRQDRFIYHVYVS